MTPQEALARVLSDVSPPDPEWVASIAGDGMPSANWPGWAKAVTDALEAFGFTVARTEHAKDGEALARLRKALPEGNGWTVAVYHDLDAVSVGRWDVRWYNRSGSVRGIGHGVSLADACREALP